MADILEKESPYRGMSIHGVFSMAEIAHVELDKRKQALAKTPVIAMETVGMVEDLLGGVAVYGDPKEALAALVADNGSREQEGILVARQAHIARDAGQTFFRLGMMTGDLGYFELGARYFGYAHRLAGSREIDERGERADGFTDEQREVMAVSLTEQKMMEMMAKPGVRITGEVLKAFDGAEGVVSNPNAVFALANWLLFDCQIGVTSAKQKYLEEIRARARAVKAKKLPYKKETKEKVTGWEMLLANMSIYFYNLARGVVGDIQRATMSDEVNEAMKERVIFADLVMPFGEYLKKSGE